MSILSVHFFKKNLDYAIFRVSKKLDFTGVEKIGLFGLFFYRGGEQKNWTILNFTGVEKSKKFFGKFF